MHSFFDGKNFAGMVVGECSQSCDPFQTYWSGNKPLVQLRCTEIFNQSKGKGRRMIPLEKVRQRTSALYQLHVKATKRNAILPDPNVTSNLIYTAYNESISILVTNQGPA